VVQHGEAFSAKGHRRCRSVRHYWEVRTSLPSNRIARVLFCVRQGRILVLHGFIKKTQKTPPDDLALARRRIVNLRPGPIRGI